MINAIKFYFIVNLNIDLCDRLCKRYYNEIADQMRQKINDLIIYCYSKYSFFGDRATYISNKMTNTFNKNK